MARGTFMKIVGKVVNVVVNQNQAECGFDNDGYQQLDNDFFVDSPASSAECWSRLDEPYSDPHPQPYDSYHRGATDNTMPSTAEDNYCRRDSYAENIDEDAHHLPKYTVEDSATTTTAEIEENSLISRGTTNENPHQHSHQHSTTESVWSSPAGLYELEGNNTRESEDDTSFEGQSFYEAIEEDNAYLRCDLLEVWEQKKRLDDEIDSLNEELDRQRTEAGEYEDAALLLMADNNRLQAEKDCCEQKIEELNAKLREAEVKIRELVNISKGSFDFFLSHNIALQREVSALRQAAVDGNKDFVHDARKQPERRPNPFEQHPHPAAATMEKQLSFLQKFAESWGRNVVPVIHDGVLIASAAFSQGIAVIIQGLLYLDRGVTAFLDRFAEAWYMW
jgi:hypothetical protein